MICHGDFGPWNVVWQGHLPVGLIDWDFAHPAARLHDVAYALQYVAPFRDDAECLRWLHFPEPPNRRRRLEEALFTAPRLQPGVAVALLHDRKGCVRFTR